MVMQEPPGLLFPGVQKVLATVLFEASGTARMDVQQGWEAGVEFRQSVS